MDRLLFFLEQEKALTNSEEIPEDDVKEIEDERDIKSKSVLTSIVKTYSRKLVRFRPGLEIVVSNKDQRDYVYKLAKRVGSWPEYPLFKPELTPGEILKLGVWGGKKFNDCFRELPREWLLDALENNKLSVLRPMKNMNYYKVFEHPGLEDWRDDNEDAPKDPFDPRGWQQWFIRFHLGRRIPDVDRKQINRWIAFNKRFKRLIETSCKKGDDKCKPRIKQSLLTWAIDSRKL